MTSAEIKRLSGAVRFMKLYCQPKRGSRLWWVTTDGTQDAGDDIAPTVWKRLTKLQTIEGLPKFSVAVLEGSAAKGRHAHIVFVGSPKIARRLEGSQFGDRVKVERVRNIDRLIPYLIKKRTPQSQWGRWYDGGRASGSHRLPGGGDRVRLSEELERKAIEAGYVEAWRRTNARRSETRKPYRPRKLTRRTLRPGGQIALPGLARDVTRLRDYCGGVMPEAVAREVEHRRRRLGLTQHQLASMIGVGQAAYANVVRRHDPLSAWAAGRLRELFQQLSHVDHGSATTTNLSVEAAR